MSRWRYRVAVIGRDLTEFYGDRLAEGVTIVADERLCEVLYDEDGVLAGGRKFTDPVLVAACRTEVQALHAQGEDFRSFFERENGGGVPGGDQDASADAACHSVRSGGG